MTRFLTPLGATLFLLALAMPASAAMPGPGDSYVGDENRTFDGASPVFAGALASMRFHVALDGRTIDFFRVTEPFAQCSRNVFLRRFRYRGPSPDLRLRVSSSGRFSGTDFNLFNSQAPGGRGSLSISGRFLTPDVAQVRFSVVTSTIRGAVCRFSSTVYPTHP